jgi:hypothetical protein
MGGVSQIKDAPEEEPTDPTLLFQERTLTCLRELQNGLSNMEVVAEKMQDSINRMRFDIHGEDVDEIR